MAKKEKKPATGCARACGCCQCCVRFFTSRPDEYSKVKAVLGLPFGAMFGIGLYFVVFAGMQFPTVVTFSLSGIFMTFLAVGYAASVQIRCIAWLVVPTFFGKEGRGYIGAMALSFLLLGPVTNIIANGWEVTRSMSCSTELAANMTEDTAELSVQPLGNVIADLQAQAVNIDSTMIEFARSFYPISHEVEDDGQSDLLILQTEYIDQEEGTDRTSDIEERYETDGTEGEEELTMEEYERKLDYRCEDVFNLAVKRCVTLFNSVYYDCKDEMPGIIEFICEPLKLGAICGFLDVLSSLTGTCNSMEENTVNEGFGDAYTTAEESADALGTNFEVDMQYQVVNVEQSLDQHTTEDIQMALEHEFNAVYEYMNIVSTLVQTVLAFLFLRVLLGAKDYHHKYVTDFKFDNIYITNYFRRIEERRKAQGKAILLPLKKFEKKEMVTLTQKKLTGGEAGKLAKTSISLVVRLAMYGMIVGIDSLVYEAMDIVRRHSYMEYTQQGEHYVNVTIYGNGAMGSLVRTLINGFNTQHAIDEHYSNIECLPNPLKLKEEYKYKIFGSVLVVWLLVLVQAYALRLRRIIAAFFYRKREKKRTLYLYNAMLKKRHGFLRHARHHVRRRARERMLHEREGVLASLLVQWPRLCCCLRRFGLGKRRCIICDDAEDDKFRLCPTPGCNFVYCADCWKDIKQNCYACREEDELASDTTLTDYSD